MDTVRRVETGFTYPVQMFRVNGVQPIDRDELRSSGVHAECHGQLEELRLADNFLGDNLNPIFSSNEFHGMKELRLLDLSRNGLRSLEEGIFKGCENLEQLYLDGNNLTTIPTMSLKGPKSLRVLSLSGNNIGGQKRKKK